MKVVDEPLYAYYLAKTGANHPGGEEVLLHMEQDQRVVWEKLPASDNKHLFLKNMAHHAIDLDARWYEIPRPVFLVRDPEEMLPSLTIQLLDASLSDTGLKRQVEMVELFEKDGRKPVVIDSAILLRDPEDILKKVCEKLHLPYEPAMLHWSAGPKPEDGVWALHWYHRVHESTGFAPYVKKPASFPHHLRPLLDECKPYYERLMNFVIT